MLSKQYHADPWCSATPFSMHYKPHSRCRGPWGRNLTRKTKQDNRSHPWRVFWFFIARLCYRNNITLTLYIPPHPSRCITNLTHHAVPSPAEIPPEHQSGPMDHTHGEFFWFFIAKICFRNKMVLTLDVPRCPFWVHCRLHSPCHEPCGRTLTGKAKKANWPHTWWVFLFFIAQLCYCKNTVLTLDALPHPSSIKPPHAVPHMAEI